MSFTADENYDSNRFLVNNTWASTGLGVAFNLVKAFSLPAVQRSAEAQKKLDDARRLAMAMAIMTQTRIAAVRYGLVMQECERGDSGVRSFVSVQSALVMYPIHEFGSDEQKNKWLPALAKGEKLGCFGLTEPQFGSNPGGMLTRAKKDGNDYILNGEKLWITTGSIA